MHGLDRQLLGYLLDDLEKVIAELKAAPGAAHAVAIFRLTYQHDVLRRMLAWNTPKEAAA